jgi:hypothetical protein
MAGKQERYFSGAPGDRDPALPLPGELAAARTRLFIGMGVTVALFGLGAIAGYGLSPDSPADLQERIASLESELASKRGEVEELKRSLTYQHSTTPTPTGALKAADRQRHEELGRRYAMALRRAKAQPAAELIEWFITKWNQALDRPEPDDRVSRRAALLSLLVGGMGRNLNPDDYVPWQAEFLRSGNWLGEVHFDLDGDHLPAKRSSPNPKDGFANVSVCHIAMALNQTASDAQVLVMPEMECDRPENRMSVFLQGATIDDALDEFMRAVKREGFLVVERKKNGNRLILVGKRGR